MYYDFIFMKQGLIRWKHASAQLRVFDIVLPYSFLHFVYHGTSCDFNVLLFFPIYFITFTFLLWFFLLNWSAWSKVFSARSFNALILSVFCLSNFLISMRQISFWCNFDLESFHFPSSYINLMDCPWVMLSFNSISELIRFPNVFNFLL